MLNKEFLQAHMDISPGVKEVLENNQAVVALKSTIISHGMSYPQDLGAAKRCEEIVRENEAISVTTAIINGRIKIGLTEEELELMATDKTIIRYSTRDYPVMMAKGLNGATTVTTSILIVKLAGIKLLVTGGIGGVHRGAQETFDISRDLQELATTGIMVVCAGCKSVLDIGLTLEYLEAFGIPVLGYQTKDIPAFFTERSDFQVDYAMGSPQEVAFLVHTKWDLGLNGGVLLTSPIPAEDATDEKVINKAIEEALVGAKEKGIHGKEAAPFFLSKVVEVTRGNSLKANITLIENNTKIGVQIACQMAKLNK